jgi:molybdate transport system substrate-binding protein
MPELKILSAGAVKRGVAQLAAEFAQRTGQPVAVEFATAPAVRELVLGGAAVDVVVAPPKVMADLAARGRIAEHTRALLGTSRMGVIVKRGAPLPDISSAEAFKRALFAAGEVIYNQASSGIYMDQLLAQFGLAGPLQDRIRRVPSGAATMEGVAGAPIGAIGVGQISEIKVHIDKGLGIVLVGPLPESIQNVTTYDAAATAASGAPADAAALVDALTSAAAQRVFAATGIDR